MHKIVIKIFVLYLLLANITKAQCTYTDTLQYSFNNLIYLICADTSSRADHTLITTIKVNDITNQKVVQEIRDTSSLGFSGGNIYCADINLDGNKDIILNLGAYNLNSTNLIWLFNKNTLMFSDQIILNDFYVNEDDSTLTSSTQEMFGHGGESTTFSLKGGAIKLLKTNYISNENEAAEFENKFYEDGILRSVITGVISNDHLTEKIDSTLVELFNNDNMLEKKIWILNSGDFSEMNLKEILDYIENE